MGRKSLAPVRTEEILEALDRCVLRDGLAATTLASVAAEAAVPRTLISHYFGGREGLLLAFFGRILARRLPEFEAWVARKRGRSRLRAGLCYLFEGPFLDDHHGLATSGEMLGLAARNPDCARVLREMYDGFAAAVERELETHAPQASPARRKEAAYAIVCLAEQNQAQRWLGASPTQGRRALRAAETLVASLGTRDPEEP
ncbi:MAG: TetR family transcriptional regulator [Myxococcota bacterium]|jgi:AcrR family transcriptional regulator|nr:TetR family transcriptional regulator [Myxococcota bacterium]